MEDSFSQIQSQFTQIYTLCIWYVILLVVLCYQLEAPDNGKMECTGNHYQDVCSFSCDEGYELTGSDTRTCQSDANWSGSDAECVPGT